MKSEFILPLNEVDIHHIGRVGGKNASLGEMIGKLSEKGINVPDGFALTAEAYWYFLDYNQIRSELTRLLATTGQKGKANLHELSEECMQTIIEAELPPNLVASVEKSFDDFLLNRGTIQVAVRSSATAEDLPEDSFAGMQETYLNISTKAELLQACKHCYASLFTARAIKYREDKGYDHMQVALSVGVQQMIRSDLASSGVAFTLDPNTGLRNVVSLSASWGLGENIVKGEVTPDEFYIFKETLRTGKRSIISRKKGSKEKTMTYAHETAGGTIGSKTINQDTPEEKRIQFAISDKEIEQLALWCLMIEEHYQAPMDIEWAKDGINGQLYIVQARPETVHSQKTEDFSLKEFQLLDKGDVLVKGAGVGTKIISGIARLLNSPKDIDKLEEGDILVTHVTSPDWDPVLKKVSAIITNRGGTTSHAAIIARETGAAAVVGTINGTEVIKDGQLVTVVCDGGKTGLVYEGALRWEEKEVIISDLKLPETKVMLILADPEQAFKWSFLPVNGVGLTRIEFAISNTIQVHPMALVHFHALKNAEAKSKIEKLTAGYTDKQQYFVDKLSESIAMIATAFYPREVIVRMSDFKTNEYAHLTGGEAFEPEETNAMLGWRGASRYYSPDYKQGFALECQAMKVVRNEMGLTNVKLMVPFCRTVKEGQQVLGIMVENGLVRGENGLEVYVMVEVPSNVFCADAFASVFDGFSIGSNDLTQLVLGVDRDSELLRELFDVQDNAVKAAVSEAIQAAKRQNIPIGLCGQAPSDYPEFAQFLVEEGIDSVSFNPDAVIKGIEVMQQAEVNLKVQTQKI